MVPNHWSPMVGLHIDAMLLQSTVQISSHGSWQNVEGLNSGTVSFLQPFYLLQSCCLYGIVFRVCSTGLELPDSSSLIGPSSLRRFSALSLHSTIWMRQVLNLELALCRFANCSISLKDPPPWSPPIFTYISSSGMAPSCHVSRPCLSYSSSRFMTKDETSFTLATGVGFSCSFSSLLRKMRLLVSTSKLPHCASICCLFSFLSLANFTPSDLKNRLCCLYFVKLRPSRGCRAAPSFADTVTSPQPAGFRMSCLFTLLAAFSSVLCCFSVIGTAAGHIHPHFIDHICPLLSEWWRGNRGFLLWLWDSLEYDGLPASLAPDSQFIRWCIQFVADKSCQLPLFYFCQSLHLLLFKPHYPFTVEWWRGNADKLGKRRDLHVRQSRNFGWPWHWCSWRMKWNV